MPPATPSLLGGPARVHSAEKTLAGRVQFVDAVSMSPVSWPDLDLRGLGTGRGFVVTATRWLSLPIAASMTLAACSAGLPDQAERRGSSQHADASAPRPVPPDSSLQPDAPARVEPPTGIRPIDPDKWAQAPQSPGRRIGLELPECIADKGCPFTPFALPPCPPGQEFVEIADAIAAVDGRKTVVRGTVWDNRLILAYDCEPRCCRGKDPPRPLLIRSFGTPPRTGMSLTLVHTNLPYALSCQEDESATCCAMEVETTVLAYGIIRMRERRIEDPRLCRFAGP
jgi:hypothetical protein